MRLRLDVSRLTGVGAVRGAAAFVMAAASCWADQPRSSRSLFARRMTAAVNGWPSSGGAGFLRSLRAGAPSSCSCVTRTQYALGLRGINGKWQAVVRMTNALRVRITQWRLPHAEA